ncbi:MAG: hypothetical protein IIY28_04860 [Lachnospiraceae bacterium]|nr:hypothetical protein [Lachnospiraceae bacterium]
MNIKKILSNALFLALIIVAVAFVPDAGDRLMSWLFPPRIYILIGVVILIVLLKILYELRNRNGGEGDE